MVLSTLRFQDAEFERMLAWCWSPLEGKSLRWVPYGVPRLNPAFKNMVFFLYGMDPESGEVVGPIGTGSFIGLEGKGTIHARHFYAVTCWHVAVQGGASILRVNTSDGKSRFIELDPLEWQYIPGADDLCAADVTERVANGDEFSFVSPRLIVTKDFVRAEELEIGEDGFMLGLFAEQPGTDHNMVAARFGNVSLLASDDAPIEQPNEQKRPSHIFDMRSRPGFSGSPVFVYRTPAGDLRNAAQRGRDKAFRRRMKQTFGGTAREAGFIDIDEITDDWEAEKNTFVALLGIHAGQYPEKVEARKENRTSAEHDDIVRDRDKLKIPSSMTVVVPAWEIMNLLNLPVFQAARRKRDETPIKES